MAKPLLVIANSESGTFLVGVNEVAAALELRQLEYELHKVSNLSGIDKTLRSVRLDKYAAVVAFGGDGTVIATALHLINGHVPLLILPGGSANSMAHEVGSAVSVDEILDAYISNAYVVRRLQVATCNNKPMLLDAHYGMFAETLEQTPRPLKNIFGRLAYAVTMLRQIMANQPPAQYEIELDGRVERVTGYVCFIVNHGRPRILGRSLILPPREGMLRVAILRRVEFTKVLRWWFRRTFLARHTPEVVFTKRAERVKVLRGANTFSVDDIPQKTSTQATFEVSKDSLPVITPLMQQRSVKNMLRVAQTTVVRVLDHARRQLTGVVSLRYSRVARNLYLGGQYGEQSLHLFRGWGVGGIVSMREFVPKKIEGIEILHLPTIDHTAPSLENLKKGVVFIKRMLDDDKAVYIHCHLGEGRGPTMAAAYLISTGMRPQDAIAHLQRTRPHARPNKKQVAQLMRFAESYVD